MQSNNTTNNYRQNRMAVTIERPSNVAVVLTITVNKADYQPEVDKSLKNLQKRMEFPGFRRGKTPMGIVSKKYGEGAKVEAINQVVSEQLYQAIEDNKLSILGEPLPLADLEHVPNFATDEDFTFLFEVALTPEINVSLSKEDKLPFYQIEVSDEMLDQQVQQLLNQHGSQQEVETVELNDLVRGVLVELEGGAPKVDGRVNEKAILLPSYIKSEEVRKQFEGATKGSTLVFEPFAAYEGNGAEVSSFIGINKDEVPAYEGVSFSLEITSISRHQPAELNEAFYTAVFGPEGDVHDEASLRAKLREGFAEQFTPESDYRFLVDLRDYVLEKAGKVEYAEDFLKSWLLQKNEGMTPEEADRELPNMLRGTTFALVKNRYVREHDIKVETADLEQFARIMAKSLFAQYGMSSAPDELIDNYAQSILKDEKQRNGIVERVVDSKFAELIKGMVTLETKTVTPEEFGKLYETSTEA